MKKKNQGLIALVLLLVVAIGVGFAAGPLTDTVTITGKASAATDFDIQFSNVASDITTATNYAKESRKSDTQDQIVVTGAYTDKDNATITVSNLKHVGDYASATFTVVNKSSDVAAKVEAAVSTAIGDTEHYQVDVTMADTATNVAKNGGTTTVTVKVSLIKAFIDSDEAKKEQTFTVTVTGTAIE